MSKVLTAVFFALIVFCGCAGRSAYINVADMPDTFQCQYMQEICQQAAEFESSYLDMTPEEQEDAKGVFDAYKSQCHFAIEECKRSAR